ncbi:MAG: hypothetical protein IKA51_04075 [Clostridia bacterium]|nr:hypothetical protein [Clostridia bacterium]
MKDIFNANISHSFFYTAPYESIDEFVAQVRQNWPNAIGYALNEKQDHPYLVDMQTAERFLKGGSQTYQVKRFFLTDDNKIDLEKSGLAGWCIMITYFTESNIAGLSFHYSVKDRTTDQLIAIKQSGVNKKHFFEGGEFSCSELASLIASKMALPDTPCEKSYLCEITKFGDYTDLEAIEREQANRMYGFLSGDEGYAFVPEELVRERLSASWGSRNFIRIYAGGKSFLFLNLLDSPARLEYLDRQTQFGGDIYGGADPYFFMGECPLTVNHGILFSVEFVMMLKGLINEVLLFQTEFSKKKFTYYKRIKMTRDFRRKIILVLEKVERTEIAEIGELSSILLESQHISPIVDQVKYLLELLEGDLSLIYSEHNNTLVTILTVLGLLLALWQILLAF